MDLPFSISLPTTNYLLIGDALIGFILFVAVAYFLFFKKPSSSVETNETQMETKTPETFEQRDAAGSDDAEGFEQS